MNRAWAMALWAAMGVWSLNAAAAEPKGSPAAGDAERLVLQALDNELAGDSGGRLELLKRASDIDPASSANWHLGRIRRGEAWHSYDELVKQHQRDPVLTEYRSRRRLANKDPRKELELARWCREQGLAQQARCHYAQVLIHPRSNEAMQSEAIERLDLVQHQGQWITRAEREAAEEELRRLAKQVDQWQPKLQQWRSAIEGPSEKHRDAALAQIRAIQEIQPLIPAILTFVLTSGERFGSECVRMLETDEGQQTSAVLCAFAVFSPSAPIRQQAIAALRERRKEDFYPVLLNWLVAPARARTQLASDSTGTLAFRTIVEREGIAQRRVWMHEETLFPYLMFRLAANKIMPLAPSREVQRRVNLSGLSELPLPLQVAAVGEYEANERAIEESFLGRARQLEASIAQMNRTIQLHNEKVYKALETTSQVVQQRTPEDWWQWWQRYNEVQFAEKPLYYAYDRRIQGKAYLTTVTSCFPAGTIVWTDVGLVDIAKVRPGDRVLAQKPDTGELAFKSVLGTTTRPPSDVLKLTVNGESIATTLGHPLWVTGKGWEMAKNIQAGDQLHGIGGIVNVNAIEPLDHKIEAHNLVVDDYSTYFVGNCGMLVHDNTYRQPTRAVVPGLIPDASKKAATP